MDDEELIAAGRMRRFGPTFRANEIGK